MFRWVGLFQHPLKLYKQLKVPVNKKLAVQASNSRGL
jgi:hypothetical protein